MNITARSTFRAGDFARAEAHLVPKITAAVTGGTQAVLEESRTLCPVDTGALVQSGSWRVAWEGRKVRGYVTYSMFYAAYNEFGTGRRGAGSSGAGPYAYNTEWPGMVAQPYLRPALDSARPAIMDSFRAEGFQV